MKYQLMFLTLLMTLCMACTTTGNHKPTADQNRPSQVQPVNADEVDSYYDFDDVLIPRDMEIDNKESLVFESPNLKAGMMSFQGRVDAISLFEFFVNSMPKDGWHTTSSFKYGRYIIGFEKPNKDCIISITDGSFKTGLHVWVNARKSSLPQTMGTTLTK
ncbi:MAG: hypothetical protein CSA21_02385 [Deltaproteobacteria bacterium]|nr:MAG: hypothetical protein CSA21_02385 [Deltaproteobacteria bacterium]